MDSPEDEDEHEDEHEHEHEHEHEDEDEDEDEDEHEDEDEDEDEDVSIFQRISLCFQQKRLGFAGTCFTVESFVLLFRSRGNVPPLPRPSAPPLLVSETHATSSWPVWHSPLRRCLQRWSCRFGPETQEWGAGMEGGRGQ